MPKPRILPRAFASAARGSKPFQSATLERAVEVAGELAAVVDAPALRLVGHLLRRDEVALADLDRTETGVAAALVDQPLDQIGRLRPPGAAIGVDRRRCWCRCRGSAHRGAECRRAPVDMVRPPSRDARRVLREIGAHVGEEVDPHGEELAVLVHRHLGDRDVVAAVGVDEEMLGAVADPLDRPAELLGRDRRQRIFLVEKHLVPKPPPTSGVITRILFVGMLRMSLAMRSRMPWPPWVPRVSV